MSLTLLVVQFRHSLSESEYAELARHAAPTIARVPGLIWKLFLRDGPGKAGGAYLFRTREESEAYVGGEILGRVRAHPAVTDFSTQCFEILEDVSLVTRGLENIPA